MNRKQPKPRKVIMIRETRISRRARTIRISHVCATIERRNVSR